MWGFGGRAITHSVTVLLLLGLWLSAFPAMDWVTCEGGLVYNYSEVGRRALLTSIFIH